MALKFLAAAVRRHPEARARLVREAQVAAQLRSPHIAVAYDLVEHDTGLFIAMEYVEGELLSARIARGAAVGGRQPRHRHAGGRCARRGARPRHRPSRHQEQQPDLTARQLVKVLDFGLAKSAPSRDCFVTEASLTMAGTVVGTLNYMPPGAAARRRRSTTAPICSR